MGAVEGLVVRRFEPADKETVARLWADCGLTRPWNDPYLDMEKKAAFQPDLFLVGLIAGRIRAVVMAGYEGHRGWINYLAVDPNLQGKGLGRRMMEEAQARLEELGCPKINLQVRTSNAKIIGFYRALGFEIDDVVSLGKRLGRPGEK